MDNRVSDVSRGCLLATIYGVVRAARMNSGGLDWWHRRSLATSGVDDKLGNLRHRAGACREHLASHAGTQDLRASESRMKALRRLHLWQESPLPGMRPTS